MSYWKELVLSLLAFTIVGSPIILLLIWAAIKDGQKGKSDNDRTYDS